MSSLLRGFEKNRAFFLWLISQILLQNFAFWAAVRKYLGIPEFSSSSFSLSLSPHALDTCTQTEKGKK